MTRLVIIDGNAILHRAYHAMPPLTTSKGELVNAVFGFTSMLLKVRDELTPEYFAVTFDLPKPTFRKKLYKFYQIKRPKMDEELVGQIEKVKEMVRTLRIPIYEKEGFEADDVIGTLVKQAGEKLEAVIVTGDRDLLQLVSDHTKVYMLIKGLTEATLFDEEKVIEKYGIKSSQIPDYKGLIGDQSDNYPGVSGIGPTTAVKLLSEFETMENLYKKLDKLSNLVVKERLIRGKEDAKLSQQLATIITNVPVKLNLKKCQVLNFDTLEVRQLLLELEFKSLIGRLTKKEKEVEKKDKTEEDKNEQMGLF